jgi:hypothetical protein
MRAEVGGDHRTDFVRWRAADHRFGGWQLEGVGLDPDGGLRLDPETARPESDPYPPGGYRGRDYYNGDSFLLGEAVSPPISVGFSFAEAIASWNADTPPGTWLETRLRARLGGERWTGWYSLGVWAAHDATVVRHSVDRQADADADVATDTLVLADRAAGADAFQLQLRLFSADGAAVPGVAGAAVALSTPPAWTGAPAGGPERWGRVLGVPTCSQMVYPDGGEVWCSPTSVAMVLAYWGVGASACEPGVRAVVAGVYDWVYRGHGNWPFNTAYAATHGMEGYVARFTSLAQAEEWIAADVPVVISFAWKPGELANAPLASAGGHISVLVGFDGAGNPVVNDTAGPSDRAVQRTYRRGQLEALWLGHSGGTVYLIHPPGWPVPPL